MERETECPAILKVTPRCGAPHGAGYACRATGGHCMPDDRCDERRKQYAKVWPTDGAPA